MSGTANASDRLMLEKGEKGSAQSAADNHGTSEAQKPILSNKEEFSEQPGAASSDQAPKQGFSGMTKTHIVVGSVVGALLLVAVILIAVLTTKSDNSPQAQPSKGFAFIPGVNISFNPKDPSSYKEYLSRLNSFISSYSDKPQNESVIECSDTVKAAENETCLFDINSLSRCIRGGDFGFNTTRPCILLTYHNEVGFVPEVYQSLQDLPKDIDENMKTTIQRNDYERDGNIFKMVWVSCTGSAVFTKLEGFEDYYFPIKDLPSYQPSLVGVFFDMSQENVKNVECKVWSKTHDAMPERPTLKFTIQKLG